MTRITREHKTPGRSSWAEYSPCERYRYGLTREWADGPRLLYVMLNPSKATEAQNDPTIERCERRARRLGFGGFRACNLFAWRETDPARLRQAASPIGPENDAVLAEGAAWADLVLCAWGVHGAWQDRGAQVLRDLQAVECSLAHLGLTQAGHPRHPLYVAYRVTPVPWVPDP